MPRIVIISPSIRKGRKSHRVALYLYNLIKESNLGEPEILDLLKYNFPLFQERLKYIDDPSSEMIDFSKKIRSSDGVVVISPEYNGASPASLKNAIDLLTDEWRKKPVALISVSDGSFAGTQALQSLQFTMWKQGALTVGSPMCLPRISENFDENGVPKDVVGTDKRALLLIDELLWMVEAKRRMSDKL